MKKTAFITAALFGLALSGAVAAEEYHAATAPGALGYFSEPADNGRWVVGYNGDVNASSQEIAELALQRAAELAAEQNHEWFAVLGAQSAIVEVGVADDLAVRAGHFLGVGQHLNTFGGEMVPMNVLERWQPRQARQTVLVIQLGSGDSAAFPGVTQQPQIFPAADRAQQ